MSLVVPHFATRAVALEGAYAAVVAEGFGWVEGEPTEVVQWS